MAQSSLLRRTVGSVLLVAVLAGSLFLHPAAFAAVSSLALAVMMNEFYRMALGKGTHTVARVMMMALCVAFYLSFFFLRYYGGSLGYLLPAFPLLAVVLIAVLLDTQDRIERLTAQDICFPAVYLLPSFLVSSLLLVAPGSYRPVLFLSVMVLVWMNDVGGYVFGMAFGQRSGSRKLAPHISPKKSWAGVAGGLAFTIAAAVCIHFSGLTDVALFQWLLAAVIVVVFGICGDLFESLIKRHYGFKDSGRIVLGHGGLLDRFDGALFAIPIVAVFFCMTGAI